MEGQEEGKGLSPKAKAGKGKGKKAGASTPKTTAIPSTLEALAKAEVANKLASPREGEESKAPASKAANKKAKKAAAKAAAEKAGKGEKQEATEMALDSEELQTAEEPAEDSLEGGSPEDLTKAEKVEPEEVSNSQVTQGKQTSDVISKPVPTDTNEEKPAAGVSFESAQSDSVDPPISGALPVLEGMVKADLGKQKAEKPGEEPDMASVSSAHVGEVSSTEEVKSKEPSLSAESGLKKSEKASEPSPKVETEPLSVHKENPKLTLPEVTSSRPVEPIAESKSSFPVPEETKGSSASPQSPTKMAEKTEVAALRSQELSEPVDKSTLERPETSSDVKEPDLPKPIVEVLSGKVLKAAEKQTEEQPVPAMPSSLPLPAESAPIEVRKGVSEPMAAILSSLPKAEQKPQVAESPLKSIESPISSETFPASVPKRAIPSTHLKVFLTGGTGSIGRAVLEILLTSGHSVTCTVKDEAAEHKLESVSTDKTHLIPVRLALSANGGEQLTALATGFDAIIHTAQSLTEEGHQIEETALRALIAAGRATAAQGQACHFIATSSLWVLGETGESAVDEAGSTANPFQFAAWRVPMEKLVLEAEQLALGFTTALIRPSWVYGSSFVDHYINVSVSKRQVIVPKANKSFGIVNNEDLAGLYRLVMERRATGVFNGCEERAVSVEELTEKMRELGLKEVNRVENPMQFIQELGFFIVGMTVHQRVLPRRALELGWKPKHAFLQVFQQLYGHLAVAETPPHSLEQVKAKSSAESALEPSIPDFRHEEQPKATPDTKDEEPKVPTIPPSEKQALKPASEDPLAPNSKASESSKEPARELPKEESKVETVLTRAVAAVIPTATHTTETPSEDTVSRALHTGAEKEAAPTVHLKPRQEEPEVTPTVVAQEEAKPELQSTLVHQHEPPALAHEKQLSSSPGPASLPPMQMKTSIEEKPLEVNEEVSVEVVEPNAVEKGVGSGPREEPGPAEPVSVVSQRQTDPLFASSISGSDLTTEKTSSWIVSAHPAAQTSTHLPAQTEPPQAVPKEETKEKPTPQSQPKASSLSAEREPAETQKADIMASRSNARPNVDIKRTPAPDHTSNKSCANCSLQ